MRYWLLTTEYPPLFGGGIATYCAHTARMMARHGHEVTVFNYDLSLSGDEVTEQDGIRVVRFVPRKTGAHQFMGFNAYISYEYARIVKEFMEAEGVPDVLESQEYHGIAYYIQQFKLLAYPLFEELSIVVTCHAPSFLCLEYNHFPIHQFPEYWTGQMEKSVIKSADLLISPSRFFVEEASARMPWNDIREQILPNPVPVNKATEEGFSYQEGYIVCFGKLSPLKGSFELIRYFDQLWKDGFKLPLHIIGGTQQIFHAEGMTMEAIVKRDWAHYLESGLLILRGEMPPAEAQEELLKAHVVLVPSIFDNFPYTVLEAMSLGKVVLASVQGGQREMIDDGQNGFLFDHRIKNDFEQKLLAILAQSKEKLSLVSEAARNKIINSYSEHVIYSRKLALLEDLLQQKLPRRYFPLLTAGQDATYETQAPANKLLSIVVPFYNMGPYIEDCIRSILDSDYPEKEIIVVEDGSTNEASIRTLNSLQKQFGFRVLRKENEGLPMARNSGAEAAKGRYMAFLDADDTVEKDYYSKAVRVLQRYDNVHFVGTWIRYFEQSQNCWPAFNPEPPYLLTHNMVNSSALVYKREAFIKAGMNDPAFIYGMEDWDSVISLVKHGFYGVVLPELLFNYRVRKDSMARAFTKTKRLYLNQLIGNKHKAFAAPYVHEIAALLNANGSGIYFDNPTFETSFGSVFPINRLLGERLKERVKRNRYVRKFAYKIYQKFKQ